MRLPFSVAILVLLAARPVAAQPSFMSILPPGDDGFVPSIGGGPGPHVGDQRAMYDALIRAVPDIGNGDLLTFFKDATIAPSAAPESVITPRPGVTITRDAFGVPHVVGATRADGFFGAGSATAAERHFLRDILG